MVMGSGNYFFMMAASRTYFTWTLCHFNLWQAVFCVCWYHGGVCWCARMFGPLGFCQVTSRVFQQTMALQRVVQCYHITVSGSNGLYNPLTASELRACSEIPYVWLRNCCTDDSPIHSLASLLMFEWWSAVKLRCEASGCFSSKVEQIEARGRLNNRYLKTGGNRRLNHMFNCGEVMAVSPGKESRLL